MLVAEYGEEWSTSHFVKVIGSNCGSTMRLVGASARRSARPSIGLTDCKSLLGGFWGAGISQSSDDVAWRFL